MHIIINGEKKEFGKEITVSELLEQLNIDPRKIAVERNQHLIRRQNFPEAVLNEGDEVEIINFVGGG